MQGINVCVVLILLLTREDDEIIKFTFYGKFEIVYT